MKFPNFLMNRSFSARALVLLAGLFLMSIAVPAQKVPEANPSGDLDQCRNGVDGLTPCSGAAWENGNVGQSNSAYSEDQYLPYRMRFSNLTVGTSYLVVLGYDTLQSNKHAIDYLGTYDTLKIAPRTGDVVNTRAGVDPCSGVTGCSGTPSQILIPQDPNVIGAIDPLTNTNIYQPANQKMSMWGGTLVSFSYGALVPGGGGQDATQRVGIVFTATTSNPVLAWSGHVAYAGDWGIGNSAGALQGSPYHMRFVGLCVGSDSGAICTTGGNQDRSLSASAVTVAGVLEVVKVANTTDGSGVANTAFPFTASSNIFGSANFTLVDNVAGTGGAGIVSSGISSFGAGNEITVTEGTTTGWTLADVTCTSNGFATAVTTPLSNRQAIVTMNEGGFMTCTFTNSQLAITAAPASITGQVRSSDGSGLSGITIRLTDLTTGEVKTATSNSFGYYTFEDLTVQDFYQMIVSAKRYRFSNASRTFTLSQDLSGVDFYCTSQ